MFKKPLERVLIECEEVFNFIDYILVYGKDKQEHDRRLQKRIETLKANYIVMRENKCIYATTKVQFLGHELSDEGVRPLDKYLSAIKDFTTRIIFRNYKAF